MVGGKRPPACLKICRPNCGPMRVCNVGDMESGADILRSRNWTDVGDSLVP